MKKYILLLLVTVSILSAAFFGMKIFTLQKSEKLHIDTKVSQTIQSSKTGTTLSFTASIFNSPSLQRELQQEPKKYPFIIAAFEQLKTLDDYKKFSKFHSKEWIYIYAIKNKNKDLWTKIWSYDYDINKYQSIFFKDKNEFLSRMNGFYDDIISGKPISYTPGNDISIYFSSSQDIKYLESLCLSEKIDAKENNFTSSCLNIMYFAKATSENKLCDKIPDGDEGTKSMKSLCLELVK